MLKDGYTLSNNKTNITGPAYLSYLMKSDFVGVTGRVTFDPATHGRPGYSSSISLSPSPSALSLSPLSLPLPLCCSVTYLFLLSLWDIVNFNMVNNTTITTTTVNQTDPNTGHIVAVDVNTTKYVYPFPLLSLSPHFSPLSLFSPSSLHSHVL